MKIAYSVLGKSNTGKPIVGHVLIESKVKVSTTGISYKILAYQLASASSFHTAIGAATDRIGIPFGPPPGDTVVPGSGQWLMGAWASNVGVHFKAVDNAEFNPALAANYRSLPPRIELCCDFVGGTPSTPFYPVGWLKLIWNPQFTTMEGLVPNFFSSRTN